MSDFTVYARCSYCEIIEGPFETMTQVKDTMRDQHRLCRPQTTPAPVVSTPARTYMRGDASRPFASAFDGNCYHCGIGYLTGDFIRMVTVEDNSKGKAVHEDCAEALLAFLHQMDKPEQSDEPPF